MNYCEYFSDTLKDLMSERQITIKILSEQTKIRLSRLYEFINEKRLPSLENAIKIAEYFHCSLDYLFGFDEEYNYCQNYVLTSDCSERLRQAINASGKTRYKISKETKVSQQQLHNWYRNKQIPSLVTLVNFADYFNCSLDYLVGK